MPEDADCAVCPGTPKAIEKQDPDIRGEICFVFNQTEMSCSNLKGEGLSEIHTHTAVVLPEHPEHATGNTPQTLILFRFALKWGEQQEH